jgi:hypothetical protein
LPKSAPGGIIAIKHSPSIPQSIQEEVTMRTFAFRAVAWLGGPVIGLVVAGCGVVDERNDPEPYRAQIEKIEDLLQKPQAEVGDGPLLSKYASDLAAAMGKNIQHLQARETVMNLLVNFGESWSTQENLALEYAAPDEEVIPFEMAEVRKDWEALRELLFAPASWFQ